MNSKSSSKSDKPTAATSKTEGFKNIALGVAGVLSSILIPLVGYYFAERQKDKEIDKGFVELGIKILSEKPSPENKPLREWAVALINNYSEVKLNSAAETFIIEKAPLVESGQRGISPQVLDKLSSEGLLLGTNLSRFNRDVDFAALKGRQIKFVYVKATQGETTKDTSAQQHIADAKREGMLVGVYHFFVPTADPIKQADNFIAEATNASLTLPPVVDCEQLGGLPIPSDYADRLDQFIKRLESKLKIKPIIYANTAFANQYLGQRFSAYPIYLAKFVGTGGDATIPPPPRGWNELTFWHLTNSVNDEVLRRFDIVGFKGNEGALAALNDRQRIRP